ncbi:LacI family DNA-binding transcriptional regulator [Jeotgalibacillus proteolyticus]|uniref:LacI family transcriptional regulator n=1 Tax=Jeotgalibacillus proteolyticus TaxID=2082395 RepID=A0A2S5GD30_9BACL|nr:LacI family DNA-binding transcriptional regulator [Jeotgalibacillus proteolyticus]PPA70821.1 LacI family transcriptional regulator [Jeotgalibacillus proteolyticus]
MVKMIDVAKRANVSTATVSRVLRNPESVKELTREKVMQSIAELNYQPNVLARHFRRSKTNTILVIVPNIANTIFSQMVQGIEETAVQNNYRVLLGNSNRNVEKEYDFLDLLRQRHVDGMILLSSRIDIDTLNELTAQFPVVLASEYLNNMSISTVRIDNRKHGKEAAAHLLSLGHKRVAHISGGLNNRISFDRQDGYLDALTEHGLKRDNRLIREGDFTFTSGYNQMQELLSLRDRPTALFAASDEMAMGAIKAAKEKGINVPEDLAVVGFDNIRFSSFFEPGLTTVAQPAVEMGSASMELLLEHIKDPNFKPAERVLKSELIVRESCGLKG